MKASELKAGRTFGVTFQHGDEFMPSLAGFCRQNDVRQGYIPMFIAGFAEADIVGTCEKLEDPQAPVWTKGACNERRSPRLRHDRPRQC